MIGPIALTAFSGLAPRVGARALAPEQAQVALDVRLTSGDLEPLREPVLRVTLEGMVGAALSAAKSTSAAGSRWLAWDRHVDAVRALVAGDRSGLLYLTGAGVPQWTTYTLAGRNGSPLQSRVLGVPAPTAAPTVSFSSGSGSVVNRAIRYSLVCTSADGWDQESQASPAIVAAGQEAGSWEVGGLIAPPASGYTTVSSAWAAGVLTVTVADTFGLRVGDELEHTVLGVLPVTAVTPTTFTVEVSVDPGAVTGVFSRVVPHDVTTTKWRIYWSEADGSYLQVGDYPTSTALPIVIPATTVGAALEPLTDAPMPPADLKSLCRHPSGALIGISGNELCMSEPYKPYAWPMRYRTPLAFDPVACRVFGRSVVVGTLGIPAVFTGADPSTMSPEDVNVQWPCLSERGMVATQAGVGYPSPYGLVWIGAEGPSLITQPSYSNRDWERVNPETFAAAPYGAAYVALRDGVREPELWLFQPLEPSAITAASAGDVTGLATDPETGALMLLRGDTVWEWDSDPSARRLFVWRSKEFTLVPPGNPGAVWVVSDSSMTDEEGAAAVAVRDAVLAANTALSALGARGAMGMAFVGRRPLASSDLAPVPDVAYDKLTLNAYVSGALVFSESVVLGDVVKLPSDVKADNVTFELMGNVRVRSLLAHGAAETLRTVGG